MRRDVKVRIFFLPGGFGEPWRRHFLGDAGERAPGSSFLGFFLLVMAHHHIGRQAIQSRLGHNSVSERRDESVVESCRGQGAYFYCERTGGAFK